MPRRSTSPTESSSNSVEPGQKTVLPSFSLYDDSRLMPDGRPNPVKVGLNRMQFGYTCPEREYIESAEVPTDYYLAEKWCVPVTRVGEWRKTGRWADLRAKEWQSIELRAWEMSKEQIAHVRAEEQQKQRGMAIALRDLLAEKIMLGYTDESTATGTIYQRPLTIDDYKKAAATLELLNNSINNSLGIQKNLGKLDDAKDDSAGPRVRRVVHRHTTTTQEIEVSETLPALPEHDTGQEFEGVVVDKPDMETIKERVRALNSGGPVK